MYKRLFLTFLFITSALLFLVFYINTEFDPYGYNSPLTNSSFKLAKVHKPIRLLKLKPEVIVIGNSRNLYAFDKLNGDTRKFYNASLAGLSISSIANLFYHITSSPDSRLKEAYISLDNVCDPKEGAAQTFEIDGRFIISPDNSIFSVLFNKHALYTSFDTILISLDKKNNSLLNESGRQTAFNEGSYLKSGSANALKLRERSTIKGQSLSESSYDEFIEKCETKSIDNILDIANKNNIRLNFFINPVNVRYWEIAYQIGSLNKYLYNKKLIQDKLKSPFNKSKAMINVFDFRRLNGFTLERLSYSDKHSSHKYWFESSHFKKELGDALMSILINKKFNHSDISTNLLDVDVEADFLSQLNILKQWKLDNPDLASEIQQAIADNN